MHRVHLDFKERLEKLGKKNKKEKEKSDHGTHHHHHEAPAAEEVNEPQADNVASTVVKIPSWKKHRSKGSHLSGFFAKPDSPLPLQRLPSVRIDDDLLEDLWKTWDKGNEAARPALWLVMASQLAIKTIVSQHIEFKKGDLELVSKLRARFKALSEAVHQAESDRAEFQVDPDLFNAKNTLEREMKEYQEHYDVSVMRHQAEIMRLTGIIEDIDQKKTDVTAETVIQKLKDLTVYQTLHHEIMENIRRTEQTLNMQSCCKKTFLFCKPDQEVSRLGQELGQLEKKREAMDAGTPDEIRQMLMAKLEGEREAARKQLEDMSNQYPAFDQRPRQHFMQVEAKIANAEQTYYKQLNTTVMELFLEVLTLIEAISEVIPRPNPLTSAINASSLSAVMDPAVDVRLCALVDGLRDRLRGQLLDYYCMEPGKFSFEVYHLRLNKLPAEQRSSILAGGADAVVKKKIFPSLESAEALNASSSLRL